jgi:hypothetical protein
LGGILEILKRIPALAFFISVVRLLLAIGLVLGAGCGKRVVDKLTASEHQAFDNAPAEVRQVWENALAADKANDYVTAQNLLNKLGQMPLNDSQYQAAAKELNLFHQRLWEAAKTNAPTAVKAVQEINRSRNKTR